MTAGSVTHPTSHVTRFIRTTLFWTANLISCQPIQKLQESCPIQFALNHWVLIKLRICSNFNQAYLWQNLIKIRAKPFRRDNKCEYLHCHYCAKHLLHALSSVYFVRSSRFLTPTSRELPATSTIIHGPGSLNRRGRVRHWPWPRHHELEYKVKSSKNRN